MSELRGRGDNREGEESADIQQPPERRRRVSERLKNDGFYALTHGGAEDAVAPGDMNGGDKPPLTLDATGDGDDDYEQRLIDEGMPAELPDEVTENLGERVVPEDIANSLPESISTEDQVVEKPHINGLLQEGFSRLSPREKEVIERRYGFEGIAQSPAEVSQAMGASEGAEQALEYRAFAKMRPVLARDEAPSEFSGEQANEPGTTTAFSQPPKIDVPAYDPNDSRPYATRLGERARPATVEWLDKKGGELREFLEELPYAPSRRVDARARDVGFQVGSPNYAYYDPETGTLPGRSATRSYFRLNQLRADILQREIKGIDKQLQRLEVTRERAVARPFHVPDQRRATVTSIDAKSRALQHYRDMLREGIETCQRRL